MRDDRAIGAFRKVDRVLTRCRVAIVSAGLASAILVRLELAGIADLDASVDHIKIAGLVRLEIFQLLLGVLIAVLVFQAYVRVALWAIEPLDRRKL